MNIDPKVERLVRDLLNAVVKQDENRFDSLLTSLKDEATRASAIHLALTICKISLFDVFVGGPSEEELRATADSVANTEQWAELDRDEVMAFLAAVAGPSNATEPLTLDPMSTVMLTFIVTGNLLAASPKIREGEWWFNYLDRIEATIEAAQ